MADKPLIPERQLLNLIEKSGGGGVIQEAKSKHVKMGFLSWSSLRGVFIGLFSFWNRQAKKKISPVVGRPFSLSFSFVNRVLGVLCACLLTYVVGDALASVIYLRQTPRFEAEKPTAGDFVSSKTSLLKESTYYQQKVASRNIFKGEKVTQEVTQTKETITPEENPITKSLSLVGISWSKSPDAFIEDKENQKTYFTKRGQMLGNGVKVEAIFKDKVILSYQGKEFELR